MVVRPARRMKLVIYVLRVTNIGLFIKRWNVGCKVIPSSEQKEYSASFVLEPYLVNISPH